MGKRKKIRFYVLVSTIILGILLVTQIALGLIITNDDYGVIHTYGDPEESGTIEVYRSDGSTITYHYEAKPTCVKFEDASSQLGEDDTVGLTDTFIVTFYGGALPVTGEIKAGAGEQYFTINNVGDVIDIYYYDTLTYRVKLVSLTHNENTFTFTVESVTKPGNTALSHVTFCFSEAQQIPGINLIKKVWDGANWADIASFGVGDTIEFKITVTNSGDVDFSSVEVSDDLPDFLTYNYDATDAPIVEMDHHIEWNLGGMDSGDDEVITFSATAINTGENDNFAEAWGHYSQNRNKFFPRLQKFLDERNIISQVIRLLKWTFDRFDLSKSNDIGFLSITDAVYDSDTAHVIVAACPNPDVKIVKKVWNGASWVDSASFNVGEDINFKITVTNTGNVDIDSYVYVDDDLPSFLTYNGDASPSHTASSTHHIEWHNLATLAQGNSVVITFSAHADTTGDADNIASVEAQYARTLPIYDSDIAHVMVTDGCEDEPPETVKEYGCPFYTDGIDDWITTSTLISLTATDYPISDPSGVANTYYRIFKWNGASWDVEIDWTIYTYPFTIPTQCYHKIEFYSVDNCSNQEEIKNQTVYVDDMPPCSWLKVTDDPDRYVCQVSTVTIEAQDSGNCAVGSYTIFCYVDGELYKTAHNKKISFQFNEYYGFREDGRYVLEYWAVDDLGNEEVPHHVESFFLDTTPPDTDYSFIGPNRWIDYHWQIEPATKIVLNATDSGAGVDYTLYRLGYSDEGGDWKTYTGPFIPDNENIFYASVDLVNNHEGLSHLYVEIVESIVSNPPRVPEKPSGDTYGYIQTSYSYKTSTTDPNGEKIKYYFNWGDGTGEWTGFMISGTQVMRTHEWGEAGTYDVKVKAQDESGGESAWSEPHTIYIINENNQPPVKPDKPSGPSTGSPGIEYTYLVQTTDPEGDLIYYTVDWGDGASSGWLGPCKGGDTIPVKHVWNSQGTYQIKVKAKDYYGEESEWSTPLSISMPKESHFNKLFLLKLLERFPLLAKLANNIFKI